MASTAELLNDIWYGKSPMRYALWPVSTVYRGLARLRRTAYQRGWRPTVEAAVPVIVVGNVSVGGTGKTPFVIWLADQLKQRGRKVGIVTRGYRGKGKEWPAAVSPDSDPEEVGGAPLLGLKGCCVIGHGKSGSLAIEAGIRTAASFHASGVNGTIEHELRTLGRPEGARA